MHEGYSNNIHVCVCVCVCVLLSKVTDSDATHQVTISDPQCSCNQPFKGEEKWEQHQAIMMENYRILYTCS